MLNVGYVHLFYKLTFKLYNGDLIFITLRQGPTTYSFGFKILVLQGTVNILKGTKEFKTVLDDCSHVTLITRFGMFNKLYCT